MGRSRSRSPARKERRRSRSRDKDRDRERHHRARQPNRRSRSRSPHHPSSPLGRRSRSPDNDDVVFLGTTKGPIEPRRPGRGKRSKNQLGDTDTVVIDPLDEESAGQDVDMMQLMGFSDFNTTKGKHVAGNDISATNIFQKRKYRQYMNRRGGFNRPLDDVR